MDEIDRRLVTLLQEDAGRSYAALGGIVGLSAGATHERVRKLRARGIVRRTTVEVDPAALGRGVLAFVMVESNAWMGDSGEALAALPEVQEAHVIAGSATLLLKVRTATTEGLQDVLRRLYEVDGVSGTQATVVLETFFERPVSAADRTEDRGSAEAPPASPPSGQA